MTAVERRSETGSARSHTAVNSLDRPIGRLPRPYYTPLNPGSQWYFPAPHPGISSVWNLSPKSSVLSVKEEKGEYAVRIDRRSCLPLLLAGLTLLLPAPPAVGMPFLPPGNTPLETTLPSPGEVHLTHVEAGPDGVLVSGDPHLLYHSTDLSTWRAVPMPINVTRIIDLLWAGDQWVVATEGKTGLVIYQSADHKGWTGTPISATVPKGPTSLSAGGGRVWLANDAGLWAATLATTAWAPVATPPGFYPRSVASDGSKVVVVGRRESGGGVIFQLAADGTWLQVAQTAETLQTVVYGEGQFLAGGSNEPYPQGTLWRATGDGPWEPWGGLGVAELKAVPGFGSIALQQTVGNRRGVHWSRDGKYWFFGQGGPYHFYDAAWVSGRILMVGSAPGITVAFGPFCEPYIDLAAADPSCGAAQRLTSAQILRGHPGQQVMPLGLLTRGQLAALLVRYKGLSVLATDPDNSDWSLRSGEFQTAIHYNLLRPGSDGTWRPWESLQREELLKTVMQAAGIEPLPGTETGYTDVPITDPLAPWVAAARQAKLIGPEAPFPVYESSTFGAGYIANRAETALLFANIFQ